MNKFTTGDKVTVALAATITGDYVAPSGVRFIEISNEREKLGWFTESEVEIYPRLQEAKKDTKYSRDQWVTHKDSDELNWKTQCKIIAVINEGEGEPHYLVTCRGPEGVGWEQFTLAEGELKLHHYQFPYNNKEKAHVS